MISQVHANPLLSFFGLSSHPFGRHTAKQAIFRHPGFEEAFRRLSFAADTDGIAQLVSEPGLGKSLLLGELACSLQALGFFVLYFSHTSTGPAGLVNVIARSLHVSPRRSTAETALALSQKVLNEHPHVLLIVDEVQEMPDTSLLDLRLLTIADFDRKSPFHLILSGQPSLQDRLGEPPHRALDQRITTVARLAPLSLDESRAYLACRLAAAGASRDPIFDDAAMQTLFDATCGVPRALNNLATGSLVVAAAKNRRTVCAQDVYDARMDRGRP
jgi:type II secretory pathway predicted ATPase ExeA